MEPEIVVIIVFSLVIFAGFLISFMSLRYRARILEMAHRERLAMIERGLQPTDLPPLAHHHDPQLRRPARSSKLLSAGIFIVGLGLAIAFLIGFTSREPEVAVGVGGAIVVLGVSLIVSAIVVRGVGGPEVGSSAAGSSGDDRSFPRTPSV